MQKFKIQKNKLNTGLACRQAGMTYVELIVVLGIFSVISTVVLFNQGEFQAKVNIKNLANEIALKIVEAQKSSVAGEWDSAAGSTWKPAYGLYFNTSTSTQFIYFADVNTSNNNICDSVGCTPPYALNGEVRDIINITKGNTISSLQVFGSGCASPVSVTGLSIVFKRPNASPTILSTPASGCAISDVLINVTSPQSVTGKVRVYSSGRIQLN